MTYLSQTTPYRRRFRLFAALQLALAVRRERKALLKLDAHLLRDLGLDRETAISEAKRALWDVPHHWRV